MTKICSTVAILANIALSGGCGDPSLLSDSGRQPILSEKEIVALSTDRELGVVAYGECATARFTILNSGKDAINLELGHPSCACTSASLVKHELHPGESAELEMELDSRWRTGPFFATVVAAASKRSWAKTFRASAVALGAHFNNDAIVISSNGTNNSASLGGRVFCMAGPPECEVRLEPRGESSTEYLLNVLSISNPVVKQLRRSDGYVEYAIEIKIAARQDILAGQDSCQGTLLIHVHADDWEQVHERDISFDASPVSS